MLDNNLVTVQLSRSQLYWISHYLQYAVHAPDRRIAVHGGVDKDDSVPTLRQHLYAHSGNLTGIEQHTFVDKAASDVWEGTLQLDSKSRAAQASANQEDRS